MPLHNGSYEHMVPKMKNKTFFCTRDVCVRGCVIQHRNWLLRSTILNAHGTNASPDGLCTRTHTNEAFSCWFCCNSFRVDRARRDNVCLEACLGRVLTLGTHVPGTSPSDYENFLYFPDRVIFWYWGPRRVVPAAAVTTHAKPHAQQQLARDLAVERAAMGQRYQPRRFGEVQRGNRVGGV